MEITIMTTKDTLREELQTASADAAPETLDELLVCMRADAMWPGAPEDEGGLDWTSLPTFGGPEPDDTNGIWSWDESRLIIGLCADDVAIFMRDDVEEE